MPGFIGLPEMLLLGFVALIIFGPKRLPEMGRSLGRGRREFRDSVSGDRKDDEAKDAAEAAAATTVAPAIVAPAVVVEPAPVSSNNGNGRVAVTK